MKRDPVLPGGGLMLGANFALPFLAMAAGASLGMVVDGQGGLVWGAGIGFGVGCAIVALVWLLFAILKKLAE
jgi:hypothetical protein